MSNSHALINEAIRKGYKVHCDSEGLWWIDQPARPRRPAATLGSYANEDRAWMGAALMALTLPELQRI